MKEEHNESTTTHAPTETEMNDMHRNAWLNFHADAQQDKQELNHAYAVMINKYGNYRNIPYGMKELLKKNYASHEAKWGENGTVMRKRFGEKVVDSTVKLTGTTISNEKVEQSQKLEKFLQNIREQREGQRGENLEYSL